MKVDRVFFKFRDVVNIEGEKKKNNLDDSW